MDWVLVFIGVIFGGLTLNLLLSIIKIIRNLRTASQRQPIDISHQNRELPPEVFATHQQLMAFGFQRLGETEIEMVSIREPGTTWLFGNPDFTVVAELALIPSGAAVQFGTIYYDDFVVETSFPIGENIDVPYMHSRRVVTDLESAWQSHQEDVARFNAEHGSPRQMRSISDVLAGEAMYRERHYQQKLRPELFRQFVLMVYSFNLTVLCIATTFELFSEPIRLVMIGVMVFGAFPLQRMLKHYNPSHYREQSSWT